MFKAQNTFRIRKGTQPLKVELQYIKHGKEIMMFMSYGQKLHEIDIFYYDHRTKALSDYEEITSLMGLQ